MDCPYNSNCDLVFDATEQDSGDGPWLMSWTYYEYNDEASHHVHECPGLSWEEIRKLEEKYNEDPYSYLPEPYVGLD